MTVRTTLAAAAVLCTAVLVGAGGAYLYLVPAEGPGPRLRRDCVSLVDTVLNEEPTVQTTDLDAELAKHGVTLPPLPPFPTSPPWSTSFQADFAKYQVAEQAYKAAAQARKAKRDTLTGTPEYEKAWNVVFGRKRDDAIRECVYKRATQEGVTVR